MWPTAFYSHFLGLPAGALKPKLKSNSNKASPFFQTILIANASDKYLPIFILLNCPYKQFQLA
jgi:hypothetical protein